MLLVVVGIPFLYYKERKKIDAANQAASKTNKKLFREKFVKDIQIDGTEIDIIERQLFEKYTEYDSKQRWQSIRVFLAVFLGSIILFYVLLSLELFLLPDADAIILIKPTHRFFIPPSVMLSGFSCVVNGILVMDLIHRRQLQDDPEEYYMFVNCVSLGISPAKKHRWLSVLASLGFIAFWAAEAVAILWVFGQHTAFTQQEIQYKEIYGFYTKTYQYSDVVKIKEIEKVNVPKGGIIHHLHLVIEFNDGKIWNSRDFTGDFDGGVDTDQRKKIINLVCSKTNLVLEKLEYDTD